MRRPHTTPAMTAPRCQLAICISSLYPSCHRFSPASAGGPSTLHAPRKTSLFSRRTVVYNVAASIIAVLIRPEGAEYACNSSVCTAHHGLSHSPGAGLRGADLRQPTGLSPVCATAGGPIHPHYVYQRQG